MTAACSSFSRLWTGAQAPRTMSTDTLGRRERSPDGKNSSRTVLSSKCLPFPLPRDVCKGKGEGMETRIDQTNVDRSVSYSLCLFFSVASNAPLERKRRLWSTFDHRPRNVSLERAFLAWRTGARNTADAKVSSCGCISCVGNNLHLQKGKLFPKEEI